VKGREVIKNILIILLSASAIALALVAYLGPSGSDLPNLRTRGAALLGQEPYHLVFSEGDPAAAVAARPVRISIMGAFGRASVQRSFEDLDEAYERLGGLMGGALEEADPNSLAPVSQKEVQDLLEQNSIYFAYQGALPTRLLAHWLDVQTELDETVSALALILEERCTLLLWTQNGVQQAALRNALDGAELLGSYRPDGSAFAFERGEPPFTRVDPMSLANLDNSVQVVGASVVNPLQNRDSAAALVTGLGFNPYGNVYTSARGVTTYEESAGTLSLTDQGQLLLQNTDEEKPLLRALSPRLEDLADCARTLLDTVSSPGDARLYLVSARQEGDETVLEFEYFFCALPVYQASGPAATVRFQGQIVRELTVQLRSYTQSEQAISLLPELQAAAILPRGSLLSVCYLDLGGDSLSMGWDRE